MCEARCVRVHFPAHQAVRSDLLPDFLQFLTNPVSNLVESGSCPTAGTVNVLQASAFCCFCKLHPQRQMRSPSPQVWMAPSRGGHTLLLSGDVGGTEESGFSQYLQYGLATRGMKDPLCILKCDMK